MSSQEEVSFKGNLCDILVDYDAIEKYEILNINKYLTVENNIKECFDLLEKC